MWVKLDDHFPDHRKLAELGDYAPLCGWLYVCGLAFCNRQLTDGRIPKAHIHRLTSFRHVSVETASIGPKDAPYGAVGEDISVEELAGLLVAVQLWEDAGDAYVVHDYGEYQPTRAEVERLETQRREGGREGARRRWAKGSDTNGQNRSTHGSTHGSTHKPTHRSTGSRTIGQRCPVPVPDPGTSNSNGAGPKPADLLALWNATVTHLPQALDLTPERVRLAQARLDEHPDLSVWRDAFTRIDTSAWCQNTSRRKGHEDWRADVDWALAPGRLAKVLEGKYGCQEPEPPADPVCARCGQSTAPYQHSMQACERIWLERERAKRTATAEAPPYEARTGRA